MKCFKEDSVKIYVDKELKHTEEVVDILRAYNASKTGELKNVKRSFYIVENGQLVAGIKTGLSWDWVHIDGLMYDSVENLQLLFEHLSKFYSDDAMGVHFESSFRKVNSDLLSLGFEHMETIKYSPLMKDYHYLEYRSFDIHSKLDREVISVEVPIEDYDQQLKDNMKKLKIDNDVDYSTSDLLLVAAEGDQIIGGVYGILFEDHMHIDILVVEEASRGKGYGRLLMESIEKEIADSTITTISLGTAEFQARGFYEKLGYRTVMTQNNYPKGFDCYTLVKDIDE